MVIESVTCLVPVTTLGPNECNAWKWMKKSAHMCGKLPLIFTDSPLLADFPSFYARNRVRQFEGICMVQPISFPFPSQDPHATCIWVSWPAG